MKVICATAAIFSLAISIGCVSARTYHNTVAELEEARKISAQTTTAFESFKKKSNAEVEVLQQEKAKMSKDLTAAVTEARDKIKGLTAAVTEARDKVKEQTVVATEARERVKDLESKLAAEQVKSGTLREEKQKLMTGTTTAHEEIARIQKRVGELETASARIDDLEKRLRERDQEIGKLRHALSDRETLASKVTTLTQERTQLLADLQKQQEATKAHKEPLEQKECGPTPSNP